MVRVGSARFYVKTGRITLKRISFAMTNQIAALWDHCVVYDAVGCKFSKFARQKSNTEKMAAKISGGEFWRRRAHMRIRT